MGTPTQAKSSKHIQVKRGDGAGPEVFTTIGEISDLNGPSEMAATLDASNFDSDKKEYILGLGDGGEVTLTMNFVGSDAQQQGLYDDYDNGTRRNFQIVLPDTTTFTIPALVTKPPSIKAGTDAVIKADVTLKVTGDITRAFPA